MKHQIAEYDEIKRIGKILFDTLSPCKVYLFGSFAKGNQTENSDYDFYVIVSDDVKNTFEITGDAYYAIEKNRNLKRSVDLIVSRNKTYNKNLKIPLTIEHSIKESGVLLYE